MINLEKYNIKKSDFTIKVRPEYWDIPYQVDIDQQDKTFESIIKVPGQKVTLKPPYNSAVGVTLNLPNCSAQLLDYEGEPLTVAEINNDTLEIIDGSFDAGSNSFSLLAIAYGEQAFLTEEQYDIGLEITLVLSGYINLSFYKKMILFSVQSLEKRDLHNAFLFARTALEGWISSALQNPDPKNKFQNNFKLKFGSGPDNNLVQLGRIRNGLSHGDSGANNVISELSDIDVECMLNIIHEDSLENVVSILSDWEEYSHLAHVSQQQLNEMFES